MNSEKQDNEQQDDYKNAIDYEAKLATLDIPYVVRLAP